MTTAFHKVRPHAPPGFFACEAAGLRWLAQARGAHVVGVRAVREDGIELERLHPAPPTVAAAEQLGVGLARIHRAGAPSFGATPPGWQGNGFFGPLEDPRPLLAGDHERWGAFYAQRRIRQVRDLLAGRADTRVLHGLDRLTEKLLDGLWDDDEPPARVHGDLWSGNVMWTADGAVLIDPAAHGGHPLTDLAMLDLFGLPFLRHVLAAYEATHPLSDGWRDLLGLHQVYPVGMHAVLFGGGYVAQLSELVDRYH